MRLLTLSVLAAARSSPLAAPPPGPAGLRISSALGVKEAAVSTFRRASDAAPPPAGTTRIVFSQTLQPGTAG
eukprot:1456716-Prymnesium_polylepis.1